MLRQRSQASVRFGACLKERSQNITPGKAAAMADHVIRVKMGGAWYGLDVKYASHMLLPCVESVAPSYQIHD